MAERQTLPVLPLRGTVIFPGLTVPIGVGRPGTSRDRGGPQGGPPGLRRGQRENVDEPAPSSSTRWG